MKCLFSRTFIILVFGGLLAGFLTVQTSCVKQKFDQPPVIVPHVDFSATATIDSLKRYFYLRPNLGSPDTMMINDDLIIQGYLNSTDESGNIYKTMFIQDSTGGLTVSIEASNLNSTFKLGQRVFIKCKGLTLGTYGGMIELGYGVYTSGSTKSIGRIPATLLPDHFFLDGMPNSSVVSPVIFSTSTAAQNVAMLVEVQNIKFPQAGQQFVDVPGPNGASTNRDIANSNGTTITINGKNFIVRTSNYADFAADTVPSGVGTIRGILTVYNQQYQLAIRDINDVINFPAKK